MSMPGDFSDDPIFPWEPRKTEDRMVPIELTGGQVKPSTKVAVQQPEAESSSAVSRVPSNIDDIGDDIRLLKTAAVELNRRCEQLTRQLETTRRQLEASVEQVSVDSRLSASDSSKTSDRVEVVGRDLAALRHELNELRDHVQSIEQAGSAPAEPVEPTANPRLEILEHEMVDTRMQMAEIRDAVVAILDMADEAAAPELSAPAPATWAPAPVAEPSEPAETESTEPAEPVESTAPTPEPDPPAASASTASIAAPRATEEPSEDWPEELESIDPGNTMLFDFEEVLARLDSDAADLGHDELDAIDALDEIDDTDALGELDALDDTDIDTDTDETGDYDTPGDDYERLAASELASNNNDQGRWDEPAERHRAAADPGRSNTAEPEQSADRSDDQTYAWRNSQR